MEDRTRIETATHGLLLMHQRRDNGGGCHCGNVALGESYTWHVTVVLSEAGVLA